MSSTSMLHSIQHAIVKSEFPTLIQSEVGLDRDTSFQTVCWTSPTVWKLVSQFQSTSLCGQSSEIHPVYTHAAAMNQLSGTVTLPHNVSSTPTFASNMQLLRSVLPKTCTQTKKFVSVCQNHADISEPSNRTEWSQCSTAYLQHNRGKKKKKLKRK